SLQGVLRRNQHVPNDPMGAERTSGRGGSDHHLSPIHPRCRLRHQQAVCRAGRTASGREHRRGADPDARNSPRVPAAPPARARARPPAISVSNIVDTGTVHSDQPSAFTIAVRNVGRSPLEILKISRSCGCTEVEMDEARIPRGQQRLLKVTYTPKAPGKAPIL